MTTMSKVIVSNADSIIGKQVITSLIQTHFYFYSDYPAIIYHCRSPSYRLLIHFQVITVILKFSLINLILLWEIYIYSILHILTIAFPGTRNVKYLPIFHGSYSTSKHARKTVVYNSVLCRTKKTRINYFITLIVEYGNIISLAS